MIDKISRALPAIFHDLQLVPFIQYHYRTLPYNLSAPLVPIYPLNNSRVKGKEVESKGKRNWATPDTGSK
jgi:hypothetical protein